MKTVKAIWAIGLVILTGMLLFWVSRTPAQAPAPAVARVPLILDTDLGSDVDDAFALALILASPELELRGVTTVSGKTEQRALMACRFLTMTGRRNTPVAAGGDPQPTREIGGQYQYYYHPDVLFNRTTRPQKEAAVDFLYARLKAQPGKLTLVATGPLTNIARLITDKPDCKPWIGRIVLTGGSLRSGPEGKPVAEANLRADIPAAQTVLASGIPLIVVPLDATAGLKLTEAETRPIFSPHTALTHQVQALYQLSDQENPVLADPLTVALCVDERFCKLEALHVEVDEQGFTRVGKGKANARVATSVRREEFLKWYVERMASCVAPAGKPAQLVPQGAMPNRVHVAEDYDSDIERRWWMSGKAETKNLLPGSSRACRGVLTHDFDDLLGSSKAMYTAVIFNPVPGPPMGQHTRLSFHYWLKGTDTLRVQIYSLSNGYHRHLVLTGLTQEKWQAATVDMTVARRPDGTGGPLAEGERIDDIQFYTDSAAELLIDNIVLYDAAPPGERRPFPKRILFTGWFDSGKQGKEWPGSFSILPDKGAFWHAAQSVDSPEAGLPWIRLHLRGERTLGDVTHLSFRYHLSGADGMRVVLVNRTAKTDQFVELKGLARDQWAVTTVDFAADGKPSKPKQGDQVDEIHFRLPKGAELLLDDLLLYEPGG